MVSLLHRATINKNNGTCSSINIRLSQFAKAASSITQVISACTTAENGKKGGGSTGRRARSVICFWAGTVLIKMAPTKPGEGL